MFSIFAARGKQDAVYTVWGGSACARMTSFPVLLDFNFSVVVKQGVCRLGTLKWRYPFWCQFHMLLLVERAGLRLQISTIFPHVPI